MLLFQIPLMQRSTILGSPGKFGKKVKCFHIDKVGLFIYYEDEKQLDPNFIRKHLTFREHTYCIIEADTAKNAINIFYEKWEGAKIGGESVLEEKALWIDKDSEILELPNCERLHKNKKGEFICGEQGIEEDLGIWGGCTLEGYDAPEDCPIHEFTDKIYDLRKQEKLSTEIIQGFKVVSIKMV